MAARFSAQYCFVWHLSIVVFFGFFVQISRIYYSQVINSKLKYYYDSNSGRLEYSINVPESTGTYYTYDSAGRLSGVYPATYDNSNTPACITDEEEVEHSYNTTGRLESIATVTTEYILNYDALGNKDSVYAGNYRLSKYEYNSNNGKITKVYYGSGTDKYVRYVYDSLENVSEIWYNNGGTEEKAFEYSYTSYGQLARVDNLLTGKSTAYKYDTDGKLVAFVEYDAAGATNEFSSTLNYNDEGKLYTVWHTVDYSYTGGTDDHDFWYLYSYHSDGRLECLDVTAGNVYGSISYSYDVFKRLDGKVYHYGNYTNTVGYTYSTYTSGSLTRTSSQVATYSSQIGNGTAVTSTYTYDGNGNITKIQLSTGAEYRYRYDNLGQLLREDNTALNKTFVYTYDNAGNILSKKTYNLTAEGSTPSSSDLISTNTYTYNDATWGDLLNKFNNVSITYDDVGNPLSYYNGSSYTFTWKNGRQLATAVTGSYSLSFDYNDEGIRTSKTVNGKEHVYHLSEKQIETEEWDGNLLVYLYDAEGSPIGMQYRNDTMPANFFYTFWFEKNLQGDVVAVYNSSGTKCVTYTYDAWGNSIPNSVNISDTNYYATYNPFTYRGYYYDTETGFYYLNSRYYDPATGRFINADGQLNGGLLGYNQFAYCANDPVISIDSSGTMYSRDVGTEKIPGAILIIDYGKNGVPIVGHSALYYYDSENSTWRLTEFCDCDLSIPIAVLETAFVLRVSYFAPRFLKLPILSLAGTTVATISDNRAGIDPLSLIETSDSTKKIIPLYGDYSYVSQLTRKGDNLSIYSLVYFNCGVYVGSLLQSSPDADVSKAARFCTIPAIMGKLIERACK